MAHQPILESIVPHYVMGCSPSSSSIPVCLPLLILVFLEHKIHTFVRNWSRKTLPIEIRLHNKSRSKKSTVFLVRYALAFHVPIYMLQL